jgi:hypothetical protein
MLLLLFTSFLLGVVADVLDDVDKKDWRADEEAWRTC